MRISWLAVLNVLALSLAIGGCAPPRGDDDDDDDIDDGRDGGTFDTPDAEPCFDPVMEVCNNAHDDDCDGFRDCEDDDCAADSACYNPNCGQLQTPEASLALPDGACPEDETQPCEGYEASINFTGFSEGQQLLDITKLNGICVNMEHSWMRDLVIYAECPNGTRVMLSDFVGREGGAVFLGEPDQSDGPDPGVGYDYCWTDNAANEPWIPYANDNLDFLQDTLPAGDYQPSESFDAFNGCPLNGDWTIRVEDRWGMDNGFIFRFWIKFDPSLVEDCSTWFG